MSEIDKLSMEVAEIKVRNARILEAVEAYRKLVAYWKGRSDEADAFVGELFLLVSKFMDGEVK